MKVVFIYFLFQLKNPVNIDRQRIKVSVDTQLISYSFLVTLINRLFGLKSNFTLVVKENCSLNSNFLVTDDFDVDGCLMNTIDEDVHSPLEFLVYQYPRCKDEIQIDSNDWQICDSPADMVDYFETITIRQDSIVVSIKPKDQRQETFLQKATGWLHGSVQTSMRSPLTKGRFSKMFDTKTGRLIDPISFRQHTFDFGIDPSIRKLAWCYLLRVFNESMTYHDKDIYVKKSKERYDE